MEFVYVIIIFLPLFIFAGYGVVCKVCKKWFSSQPTLIRHKIWHHREILPSFKYNCDQCPYGSNELTNYKKHALCHDMSRPHVCKVCGNRFKALQSLSTHILIHYGEDSHNFNFLKM